MKTKTDIKRFYGITDTDLKAISYIGRHRKSDVKPHRKSCDVSVRTANKLIKRGFVMALYGKDNHEDIRQGIMLTLRGELVFSKLHPTSKYAIKNYS